MAEHSYKEMMSRRDHLGHYPMEKLKRVDMPTTRITDNVSRFDERQHGFARVMRGELGPVPQKEMMRFVPKFPLGASFAGTMAPLAQAVDGEAAKTKAPLSEDPEGLSRH